MPETRKVRSPVLGETMNAPSSMTMPRIMSLLLVLAAVALLATGPVLHGLDPAGTGTAALDAKLAVSEGAVSGPESAFGGIAHLALFGVPAEAPGSGPIAVPDTALPLRLVGVYADASPEHGRAIIVEANGAERLYRVGDPLGEAAIVRAVHADQVIIERQDGLEALRLPRTEGALTALAPEPGIANSEVEATADTNQPDALALSPQRLLALSRPVHRNGALHGLEIEARTTRQPIEAFGLQQGDVIVAVNGLPVSAVAHPNALVRHAARQNQLELVVERDGLMSAVSVPFAIK
jgi:general secretion pathway protein C